MEKYKVTSQFPQTQAFSGPNAPVRIECDMEDLLVDGNLPSDIDGTWYRLGPDPKFAPLEGDDLYVAGDGVISSVKFENGRVAFKMRYVQTERLLRERAAGRALYGAYRNPFTDDASVAGTNRGTANTTPVWHGGRLLALKEDSLPYELDPETLETRGIYNFQGRLKSPTFTAHPKLDPETGELFAFAYECGGEATNTVALCVISPDGELIREEQFEAPYASFMHDFAVTREHIIFLVFPTTADLDRIKSGGPHWVWDDSKDAYAGVMRRDGTVSELVWFRMPPCYAFHVMNAFTEGDLVNVDLCLAERNPFPGVADINNAPFDPRAGAPFLTRLTFNLKDSKEVRKTQLAPMPGDMPIVAAKSAMSRQTAGYYAGLDPSIELHNGGPAGAAFNHLCRVDFESGAFTALHLGKDVTFQEPMHVASSNGSGEGYLLAIADRHDEVKSDIVVLSAANPERGALATIHLPFRLRNAFHGTWVPSSDRA
jgi:carotenoid cleavage dioxygenase-like enzyme